MLKNKKFTLILLLILALALVLRLRGFDSHFLLSSDSGRDILVAKGAVSSGEIPWVGSFSSAGPFVFGPNWYWFLMLPALFAPSVFQAPWIAMFIISLGVVLLMLFVGKTVGGKKLGLVIGLITAISPATVGLSSYLTQHAMVTIFSALTLLGFVGFLRYRQLRYIFLISFGVGAALSMHYQGLYLLAYYPLLLFFILKYRVNIYRAAFLSLLGFLCFMWPLIYWDSQRSFTNTEQVIYYFREGQYRFWVSNRWLFYLRDFVPEQIGKLFGGGVVVGRILEISAPVILLTQFIRRRLNKYIFSTAVILIIQLIGVRYQRGEKYDGYLIFLHPLLLFVIGWTLWQISKFSRPAFFGILMVILTCGIYSAMPILDWKNDAINLTTFAKFYKKEFPGQKVNLYAHSQEALNCSYSLSTVLQSKGLADQNGKPVGVCLYAPDNCFSGETLPEISRVSYQNDTCVFVDLSGISDDRYKSTAGWYPMNMQAVYQDVQGWWQK